MKKRLKLSIVFVALTAAAMPVWSSGSGEEGDHEGSEQPPVVSIFAAAQIDGNTKLMYDQFTAETGIGVDVTLVPGEGVEMYQKIDIAMMSGDKTDAVILLQPIIRQKYIEAGLIQPLDELAAAANYDMEATFGKYLYVHDDGLVYSLPVDLSIWGVFYNKQIFDDAGVPYPEGSWTWDDYIATAEQLNDPENGIYGSYMLDYENYMYFHAIQREVPAYKPDGTSNYDDPRFAEALQFFGDLGNVHNIQPNWLEFETRNYSWNQFTNGTFGMHFIGSWYLGLMANLERYPRDWDWGVTQVPTPPDGRNSFGVTTDYAISTNSANPEAAFEFIKFRAENTYRFLNRMPARVDLSDEELAAYFQGIVDNSGGSVTVADLRRAFLDNDLGFVQEKILGPAAAIYNEIILQESELYLIGQKTLDDAVASIKRRADEAILSEREE